MSDAVVYGLKLSLVGIVVVFAVLAFIAAVISLMRSLDRHWEKRESDEAAAALDRTPTIDDLTVILISAAAATMIQGRFRIRSIRRIAPGESPSSAWSMQGRTILHGSHVLSRRQRV